MNKIDEMNKYELKSEYENCLKNQHIYHEALRIALRVSLERGEEFAEYILSNRRRIDEIKKVAAEKNCLAFIHGWEIERGNRNEEV